MDAKPRRSHPLTQEQRRKGGLKSVSLAKRNSDGKFVARIGEPTNEGKENVSRPSGSGGSPPTS